MVGFCRFRELPAPGELFYRTRLSQAWEYADALPRHDPQERFRLLIAHHLPLMLADTLPALRAQYLDLQLTLDWLRHPLERADNVAVALHCARLLQWICRIAYLLERQPFPHDKWLYHYMGETRFGRKHRAALLAYTALLSASTPRHHELEDCPQYTQAEALLGAIAETLRRTYAALPWLKEWWRYV